MISLFFWTVLSVSFGDEDSVLLLLGGITTTTCGSAVFTSNTSQQLFSLLLEVLVGSVTIQTVRIVGIVLLITY